MTTTTATTELLASVERIRPVIEEHAATAEAEREAPEGGSGRPLWDSGLFGMLQPRAYSGAWSCTPSRRCAYGRLSRESIPPHAWNLEMNGVNAAFAAFLAPDGAQELMGEGPITIAGAFIPPGQA